MVILFAPEGTGLDSDQANRRTRGGGYLGAQCQPSRSGWEGAVPGKVKCARTGVAAGHWLKRAGGGVSFLRGSEKSSLLMLGLPKLRTERPSVPAQAAFGYGLVLCNPA